MSSSGIIYIHLQGCKKSKRPKVLQNEPLGCISFMARFAFPNYYLHRHVLPTDRGLFFWGPYWHAGGFSPFDKWPSNTRAMLECRYELLKLRKHLEFQAAKVYRFVLGICRFVLRYEGERIARRRSTTLWVYLEDLRLHQNSGSIRTTRLDAVKPFFQPNNNRCRRLSPAGVSDFNSSKRFSASK